MCTDAMSLTEVETLLNPLTPVTYRIVDRRVETGDVVTLFLEPTSGSSPLSFRPGQFNMLDVLRRRGGRDLDQQRCRERPGRSSTPSATSAPLPTRFARLPSARPLACGARSAPTGA